MREVAALAGVAAVPSEPTPAVIVLSTNEAQSDTALLICRYAGDLPALRSTLIAMRLTTDDVAVRLVSNTRPPFGKSSTSGSSPGASDFRSAS